MPNTQIVAMRYGSKILTNRVAIATLARSGRMPDEMIDRRRLQFLAACDLGPQWLALAAAPTLFEIDEDGRPVEVP